MYVSGVFLYPFEIQKYAVSAAIAESIGTI